MINNGKHFIVLDIETTGLSPQTEDIIEIAAIKVDDNLEIIDTFEYLIDINRPVPPFIVGLTGITNSMLKESGIPISMALKLLKDFAGNLNVYAHYAPFDKGFIRTNLRKHSIDYIESEWIDTIKLFKQKWPNRKTYKLESLIIDLDLATKEDHRGLSDAKHTLALMKMTKE